MGFLFGSKLNTDDPHISLRHAVGRSIGKGMNPDFPGFNLVQQTGDVLIILGLRLGKPGVLSHAFQHLLSTDLAIEGRDAGKLFPVRLPSGKGQHIPKV